MKNERLSLATPHMSDEGYEKEFINEAFDTNWIAPLGKNVDEFEIGLAKYVEAPHAAALYSGTAAIHMALKAAGIKKGDNVFCQSLTFSATVNPVIYECANPIFIDSDLNNWNMSPEALKKAFTKYPDTRIVIVVNLYGIPAKLDLIRQICEENNAILIEDAAESLGSVYKGKQTGTFGTYGVYSFNGNKIITTSGGGMLICNNNSIAEERIKKVRFWSTQAREQARHYQHNEIGYNYRLSNISAGIGRGQLMVLDQRIKKKQYIFDFYKRTIGKLEGIEMMPIPDDSECNCWLSCILLTGKIKPLDVIQVLDKENIESRPIWKPMHMQPVFSNCDYIDNGSVSKYLFENGVCLPSDTKMTDEDLNRVVNAILGLW